MDFFRRVNDGKSVQQTLQKEEQLYIKSCISKTAFNMLQVMVHCSAALSLPPLPQFIDIFPHTLTYHTILSLEIPK